VACAAEALALWHNKTEVTIHPEWLRRDRCADIYEWDGVPKSKAIQFITRLDPIYACNEDVDVSEVV